MGVGILDCDLKDIVYSCVEKTLGLGFIAVSLLFKGVDRRGARSLKRPIRLLFFSSDLSEELLFEPSSIRFLGARFSCWYCSVGRGMEA